MVRRKPRVLALEYSVFNIFITHSEKIGSKLRVVEDAAERR